MKILVTGSCGFLGSHVVDALKADHGVFGVDNLTTGRAEWCSRPFEEMPFYHTGALHSSDVIVHCAAVADISCNWIPNHNREDIFATNVLQTHDMLERLADGTRCKHLIFISTAAVDSPQQSPYTASKIAGEAMCRAYCQALNIHLTIIRPVSMLGPRYHHGHVVDFVRMATRDGVIRAKDNGHQRKPYCHVGSVADTVATCVRRPPRDPGLNLVHVAGIAWGVAWTAEMIGAPVEWAKDGRGWTGDPDIPEMYFQPNQALCATWVQETIDWVKEDQTWTKR